MQDKVNALTAFLEPQQEALPELAQVQEAVSAALAYNEHIFYQIKPEEEDAKEPNDFEKDYSKSIIHVAKNKMAFGILYPLQDIQDLIKKSGPSASSAAR